ncbi:Protein PAT1 1 [Globodera pallida]|nr:Protein PAT1 1 [Globodera pallida]
MDGLLPFFQESTTSPDLQVLGFAVGAESENGKSIPDEELYDAVNDETFGADITSIATNADDLEEFSTRTANLALFDESCSIQLPDPSQIPIPPSFSDLESDKLNANGTAQSVSSSSIWGSGSFNGIHSLAKNYAGTLRTECQNVFREAQKKQLQQMLDAGFSSINQQFVDGSSRSASANPPSVANIFIEQQQLRLPKMPVSTASNQGGTFSVEELERRMLMEVSANTQVQKQQRDSPVSAERTSIPTEGSFCIPPDQSKVQQNVVSSMRASQKSVPGGVPSMSASPMHLPNPQQLMQLNQLMQHYQMALAAAAANGYPPPPLPPLPFFPHPSTMPPIAAVTPQTPISQCQDGRASSASFISHIPSSRTPVPFPMQSTAAYLNQHPHPSTAETMPQLSMVPSSLHPRTERSRRQRLSGLPSEKTISDFALDPYAGFMSTKEREWLIKIHIIQCLGSGDPVEDDYYYTMWKQQNVLQKAPEPWKNREKPKYYKFEATFPSTGYIAPSFLGSLGKPIHSTTSQPRQIIEVNSDNTEDGSVKNRQKRLRAVLMKIENGALALLDCRSIQRKLRFFEETCITQFLDKNEITGRTSRFADNLAQVDASLFSVDSLPTVMLIQKGRFVLYDWLKFWREEKDVENVLSHTRRIFSSMPKFARKMPEIALKQFASVVCQNFADFSLNELVELLQHTAKWELPLICESKLVQLTLLSLVLALIDQSEWNVRLNALRGTGAAKLLDSMPVSELRLDSATDGELFKSTQWAQLRQWLIREQSQAGGVPPLSLNHPSLSKKTLNQWIMDNQTFVLI